MRPEQEWVFPDTDPMERSPSPRFLEVVQDMADQIGLDAQAIVSGAPLELKGVTFWLGHHGDRDPDGLFLYIHMGDIDPALEAPLFRQMLVHNAITPAAVGGYYSLLPDSNTAAFCIRMNMARASNPVAAVLAYIGMFAHQVDELAKVVDQGMALARQAESDAARHATAQTGAPS